MKSGNYHLKDIRTDPACLVHDTTLFIILCFFAEQRQTGVFFLLVRPFEGT